MDNPIRILHVVVNMNRGGAETLIMNLYRNIDRSKVQFDFLTSKEGVFDKEIEELGGKIHRIPYLSEVGHYKYKKFLKNFFLNNNKYKIVHSHLDRMSGIVLNAAKKAKIPIRIAHSHNTKSEGGIVARLYKWYASKMILPSATELIACSDAASKWLFDKKCFNVAILKNGIDLEQFTYSPDIRKKVRRKLNIKENSFVIGHVGRFNRQKNHEFLIEIFAELLKRNSKAILVLAGDGTERSSIERKIADHGIKENVKFLGIRSDVNLLLQAFDVFVFPSLHEGLPVTVIEAQVAGVPCVISNTITSEVDLNLDLVTFLPLNDTTNWVNYIENKENSLQREVPLDVIKTKGYDIKITAKWIENYYLSLMR